jgi:hypothetical protein
MAAGLLLLLLLPLPLLAQAWELCFLRSAQLSSRQQLQQLLQLRAPLCSCLAAAAPLSRALLLQLLQLQPPPLCRAGMRRCSPPPGLPWQRPSQPALSLRLPPLPLLAARPRCAQTLGSPAQRPWQCRRRRRRRLRRGARLCCRLSASGRRGSALCPLRPRLALQQLLLCLGLAPPCCCSVRLEPLASTWRMQRQGQGQGQGQGSSAAVCWALLALLQRCRRRQRWQGRAGLLCLACSRALQLQAGMQRLGWGSWAGACPALCPGLP